VSVGVSVTLAVNSPTNQIPQCW